MSRRRAGGVTFTEDKITGRLITPTGLCIHTGPGTQLHKPITGDPRSTFETKPSSIQFSSVVRHSSQRAERPKFELNIVVNTVHVTEFIAEYRYFCSSSLNTNTTIGCIQ